MPLKRYLNWLATNRLEMFPWVAACTPSFFNERGGIEADVTDYAQWTKDTFLVVTPAFTHTHVFYWIKGSMCRSTCQRRCDRRDLLPGPAERIQGPKLAGAVAVNQRCGFRSRGIPVCNDAESVDVGYSHVARASELPIAANSVGSCIVPTEYLQQVLRCTYCAPAYRVRHASSAAITHLTHCESRRLTGNLPTTLVPMTAPVEAGLDFTCKFDKARWLSQGMDKVRELQERGKTPLPRRLVQFLSRRSGAVDVSRRAHLSRRGVTSATPRLRMYGYTLGGFHRVSVSLMRRTGVTADFVASAANSKSKSKGKRYPARAFVAADVRSRKMNVSGVAISIHRDRLFGRRGSYISCIREKIVVTAISEKSALFHRSLHH